MKNVFAYDSPVIKFLTVFADLIIINVIYLIFCIPIITIGAAKTALYRVMLNYEKGENAYPVKQFWTAFRENIKPSTILFAIMLIPLACTLYYCIFILTNSYTESKAIFIISIVSILLVSNCWSFLWPMQAQFDNSIGNTIKNSLLLSFKHFLTATSMSVINCIPILLVLFLTIFFLRISLLWFFLYFSLAARINTKLILIIFRPFLQTANTAEKNPADDIALTDHDS